MSDLETDAFSNKPFARRRSEKNDNNLRILLVSHMWSYELENNRHHLGHVLFLENGFIGNYKHANEQRWAVRNNVFTFMTDNGLPTSQFILLFGGLKPVFLGKSVIDPEVRFFLNCPESLTNTDRAKED